MVVKQITKSKKGNKNLEKNRTPYGALRQETSYLRRKYKITKETAQEHKNQHS